MNILTLAWITFPFFLGFVIYLVPKLDKQLSLFGTLVSVAYALKLFTEPALNLKLLGSFGVVLTVDSLTAYFILTNAIVTIAVLFYCWQTSKSTFFYAQTLLLHASINAAFVCSDFLSLYIALEVSGIAAFLLIAYPRTDRSIWVGLRYLFTSNVAMLFYLIGTALVYKADHSFSFTGLQNAPPEAVALLFLGLLVKAGVFISGLWLPMTHSEAETPVSALLSGVVVKASLLALVRCALILDDIDTIVRIFGVATTLLGVFYAVFEKDTKRMLAFHTVSQLGFILAAPEAAGFYTLSHGLVKSSLFLLAGNLPSRNFKELQTKTISTPVWIALVIASLSISGSPLWAGFGAKVFTLKNLLPWQVIAMNVCAVGTATSFAKFIFLPHGKTEEKVRPGLIAAIVLLLGGLLFANIAYIQAYTVENIVKAFVTIGGGWLAYWVIFRRATVKLPRMLEEFEHLVGMMGLTLILLFWMALA